MKVLKEFFRPTKEKAIIWVILIIVLGGGYILWWSIFLAPTEICLGFKGIEIYPSPLYSDTNVIQHDSCGNIMMADIILGSYILACIISAIYQKIKRR